MAAWIAVALGVTMILSTILVVSIFAQFVLPESELERDLKGRYLQERLGKKQAIEVGTGLEAAQSLKTGRTDPHAS